MPHLCTCCIWYVQALIVQPCFDIYTGSLPKCFDNSDSVACLLNFVHGMQWTRTANWHPSATNRIVSVPEEREERG
jgi:hypothetical protein